MLCLLSFVNSYCTLTIIRPLFFYNYRPIVEHVNEQVCEYHDLWDPLLDGPGYHWAYVLKRPDSTQLTKTRRTLLKRENI